MMGRRRGVRFALGAALALLAAAGLQAGATSRDRARHPPRGRMIGPIGRRLRLIESGAAQPGPTVVLECGIGGATAASWGAIRPGVAAFAPVVAYDRAGLGFSDAGPRPRDGERLVAELHALLERAALPPPYVLVGHSYGGLLARLYTERHPREVVGVVLLESSDPGQFREMPWMGGIVGIAPLLPLLARLGVIRAVMTVLPTDADRLPEPDRSEQRAFLSSTHEWEGVAAEMVEWDARTNPQVRAVHDLGERPLRVLTAEESARIFGGWSTRQMELARLSSRGIHRVIAGANHGSLISDPRFAPEVVRAIREVVDEARAGAGLNR